MSVEVYDKNGQKRDLQWLETTYRVTFLDAGEVPKFRLVRIDETEGPAAFIVQVRNEEGQPHAKQPVANHWPGVEGDEKAKDLRNAGIRSVWRDHAIIQDTNANGDTGFGYGGGSVIHDTGGPHTLWVLSPSLPSDALSRVGWLGGTDHRGPCRLTFQITRKAGPGQPIPDDDVMAKLEAIHNDLRSLMTHLGAR